MDRVTVGAEYEVAPGESADQHEQGGFRQVEVGEQGAHHPEFEAGIDEDIGFAVAGSDVPVGGMAGDEFQGTDRRRSDGYNAPAGIEGAIDLGRRGIRDEVQLLMQPVLLDPFDANGLEGTQPDMQSNLGAFDAPILESGQDLGSEVKTGSWSSDRTALPGIHGLVTLPVARAIVTIDVGRKRHMPQSLKVREEIRDWGEAEGALAKGAAGKDFGTELGTIGQGVSEEKMLAHADFAPGADQALPVVRFGRELAGQQYLNAALEKVAGGGIVGAQGLGSGAPSPSVEPGGKHTGIVDDE